MEGSGTRTGGDPDEGSSPDGSRLVPRLLAVVAVAAAVWLLRVTRPVTLPLAFALFLAALFWPLHRWLEERVHAGVALVGSLLALLLAGGALVGALWLAAEPVVERAPSYIASPDAVLDDVRSWARDRGFPVPEAGGGEGGGLPGGGLEAWGRQVFSLFGGLILVVAFYVLALSEVSQFRRKLSGLSRDRPDGRWRKPLTVVVEGFRRYVVVRTGVGLVTGVAVALYAWAIGLEMAVVWGALNYLLNYIPTLGSVAAVIPPTLFALGESGTGQAGLALVGIGAIQLLMGNYVDPVLEGKYLRLSPLVVLLSVVFWGWLWGIPGAFIGVPLTVALVTTLRQFDRTRWLSALLADLPDEGEEGVGDPPPSQGRR